MSIRLDGEALMERAQSAGHLTQDDIAVHTGIGRTALSKLLQGVHTPKVATLVALRDAYGFPDIDTLLKGAERATVTVPPQAGGST